MRTAPGARSVRTARQPYPATTLQSARSASSKPPAPPGRASTGESGSGSAGADIAVELRGITKRFPGVVANHDIDITVRRGTVHALVGENGAGKSTLMKILYGMQRPDEGTITLDGTRADLHSPGDAIARGVGMVHQHFMLADNFTVLENIVLGAEKLHGIGGRARRKIQEISDAYGLGCGPTSSWRTSASPTGSGWRSSRSSTGARAR